MVSSTNGIPVNSPDGYDELVYDDVHISDTGEYVHYIHVGRKSGRILPSERGSGEAHGAEKTSPRNPCV